MIILFTFQDAGKEGCVVTLGQIIQFDKSVLQLADLPKGYLAIRQSVKEKWIHEEIEYFQEEMMQFGYYCSKSGEYHTEIPMSYGSDGPLLYLSIPEAERAAKAVLSPDDCVLYGRRYYIRGIIPLQVDEQQDTFYWSVWVEVSRDDHQLIMAAKDDENAILRGAIDGQLSSQLEPYPQTDGLLVRVIVQGDGYVPIVEIKEVSHPLFFEQESGINRERVIDFARTITHWHSVE